MSLVNGVGVSRPCWLAKIAGFPRVDGVSLHISVCADARDVQIHTLFYSTNKQSFPRPLWSGKGFLGL